MNTYPREILNGHTPLEKLVTDMGDGFIVPDFLEVSV
jgi:hypothetical protein